MLACRILFKKLENDNKIIELSDNWDGEKGYRSG